MFEHIGYGIVYICDKCGEEETFICKTTEMPIRALKKGWGISKKTDILSEFELLCPKCNKEEKK